MMAFFYQSVSGVFAVLFRAVTPTPSRFRLGLLSSAIFSNWGDVRSPPLIIRSVAQIADFRKYS